MTFPSPGEYQEAVQFPATAFTDPQLQDVVPETSTLGLPRAITGAFAVVFPVETRGAKLALKCFLTEAKDQQRRYRAIADHLRDAALPYTTDFEFQPDGIRVAGRTFPLLKMEWVDGTSLNRFLAQNRSSDVLETLLHQWRELVADLENASIAHGDLQHGNILVTESGLRLVDYDTMYVPALAGKKSPEVGHRNYQHPDRDEHDFGPYLDRFSALVIDTALEACRHQPELWERFDSDENILFRSEDLLDPSSSALFDELRRIDAIRARVDILERACYLEPENVPPLSEIVAGAIDDRRTPKPRTRRQPHARRTPFERWLLPAAGLGIAAAMVVAALAYISAAPISTAAPLTSIAPAAALAVSVIALTASFVVLRYRRRPEVRRRRRLEREIAYFDRLMASLRDELATMENRRNQFTGSQHERRKERLRELQETALDEHLKHHFIDEARGFDGLTHKVIVRLKASGIRTASHASPDSINSLRRLSPESKARVNLWRSTLAARYRADVPTSLSPAEERRLKRGWERELSEFDRDIARLQEKIAIQEREQSNIRERQRALDVPTIWQYTAFLLRIRRNPN